MLVDINYINKRSLGPSVFKNMEGLMTCFENYYSILFSLTWVYYKLFTGFILLDSEYIFFLAKLNNVALTFFFFFLRLFQDWTSLKLLQDRQRLVGSACLFSSCSILHCPWRCPSWQDVPTGCSFLFQDSLWTMAKSSVLPFCSNEGTQGTAQWQGTHPVH